MANQEQLALLRQGVEGWNKWRKKNPDIEVDIIRANLIRANLIRANLIRANLSGANLSGANLSGANLSLADLSGANLSAADLIRADLSGAYLSGANLIGAYLSEADLSRADLSGAYLSEADLSRANLSGADLSIAKLSRANLSAADLSRANLSAADLSLANLSEADLRSTDLSEADFNEANLSGADLSRANLIRADLSGADLSGSDLIGIYFIKADLSRADLSGAYLSEANLSGANLSRANLSEANLSGADLSGADLSRANLIGANLSRANLSEANLSGADLSGADLSGADLSEANLSRANLSRTNLVTTQALRTNLQDAILTGACIEDWNINSQTNLDNVICDYIYLKAHQQERRPHDLNTNFAPGEFTKLFQKALETVDLIFSDGIEWVAFFESFQQLREEVKSDELSIQAIEKKPGGAFVIRVEVPSNANKAEIEKYIKQEYEARLKVIETNYHKQLEAKDKEIRIKDEKLIEAYREKSTDLLEMARIMASSQKPPINLEVTTVGQGDTYKQKGNFGIGHMSGGKIKEGAKVAGFLNEANLTEILPIIESLRKNVVVLNDQETRDEAVEHLSDIENEAKQTAPKKSRLKASLLALWNIGKDVTSLANGITALAERFGISLPHLLLPPGN